MLKGINFIFFGLLLGLALGLGLDGAGSRCLELDGAKKLELKN